MRSTWQQRPLGEIVKATEIGGVYKGQSAPTKMSLLKMGAMGRGYIIPSSLEYLPTSVNVDDAHKLRVGDVLLNTRNSLELVGKVAIWRGETESAVFDNNVMRIHFDDDEIESSEFANLLLNSGEIIKRLRRMAIGTTSVAAIYWRDLKRMIVSIPPKEVQAQSVKIETAFRRISTDTDRLIQAKTELKRGLAQQLLTGQKRFPEFQSSNWVDKSIGELFEEIERPVAWADESQYRLVSIRRRSGGMFLREEKRGMDIKTKRMFTVQAGDIVISRMQIVHGALAIVPPELDGCHVSGTYYVLVPRKGAAIEPEFFNYLSQLPKMYHAALVSSFGVHIEKMTFNPEWYLHTKVRVPSSTEEQKKIVETLELMDSEIEMLTEQRANYSMYKRGLIARLLSGEPAIAP